MPLGEYMTQSEPKFQPGDRVFTHYEMQWGTIVRRNNTVRGATHGVTGSKLPDTTWYTVELDNGRQTMLDDAHGDWEMARIMPSEIAERYGYGADPKAKPKALGYLNNEAGRKAWREGA